MKTSPPQNRTRARVRPTLGACALGTCLVLPAFAGLAAPNTPTPNTQHLPHVSYNRDVRPILSDNCFACHGPDRNKRMASLRLDIRDEAIAHQAIVPGKP